METQARWHPPSPGDAAEQTAQLFEARYGGAPDGVWSAPGRVNLIGEHVDYVGGVCLPFALPQRTWAAVRPRNDGVLRLASAEIDVPWQGPIDKIGPGNPEGWAAYPAGVVWAMVQDDLLPAEFGGADVAVRSDVPLGAGLSSSAALECAVAIALAELNGGGPGRLSPSARTRLAKSCVRAENEIALAMTGGMDQVIALHAEAGHCLRLDCETYDFEQLPLRLERHGLGLLVINTNAPHRLVDGDYGRRRASVERAAALLGLRSLRQAASFEVVAPALAKLAPQDPVLPRRARHVITEISRAKEAARLLVEDRGAELGGLLNASHASLRDDYEISCVELDVAVQAARGAGALGARMVGGGFGGSAIALVLRTELAAVAETVLAEARRHGLALPTFVRAEARGAAARA
jgi:galactokinase